MEELEILEFEDWEQQNLDEDLYNKQGIQEATDEDEISLEEAAFMQGYSDALEDEEEEI
tara:strand:+ start:9038 stop:9214 length:177 start_codon:yes stop_codon:yes gene_type:complete